MYGWVYAKITQRLDHISATTAPNSIRLPLLESYDLILFFHGKKSLVYRYNRLLYWSIKGWVLTKHGHEKSACIMEGGFLSDKIRDNLIKLFDGFNLHRVFGLSLTGPLIAGADDSGLTMFS